MPPFFVARNHRPVFNTPEAGQAEAQSAPAADVRAAALPRRPALVLDGALVPGHVHAGDASAVEDVPVPGVEVDDPGVVLYRQLVLLQAGVGHCKHDHTTHLTSSGQPHFYRPATEADKRDPSVMLYRHTLPQGGSVLVRRMVVANHAELITAFCTACAESIGTHQVLCYQRNVGVGEVVGVQTGHRDMAIAA